MFLKPPQSGQMPGKATKTCAKGIGTKKRKRSEEEQRELDREYERTGRKRKFLSHWPERWPWLGHDPEKNIVFCKLCRSMPELADK